MPELPEVEILRQHLDSLLRDRRIREVQVLRSKTLRKTSVRSFKRALQSGSILSVGRRGKYLLFEFRPHKQKQPSLMLGHLGMTGRMYLQSRNAPLPKHACIVLEVGIERFVFEDTRYFGRLTFELAPLDQLGPEPLGSEFTAEVFGDALKRSGQPIKVKLLDQSLVAGIGNIYASEALF